ncbi:NAD-dependent epimerase/dehydratase family protein [Sinosporangium siamense]|uniref:Epimerase n=1 Tax=Sinosporangium siamense TaxID=1367973 RepID=A0A919V5B7_9ACTN|nr:SDR family oxidoreductase [Sinosporangium siamense]GII92835.1 epimerase [Sinosporangium siamense]
MKILLVGGAGYLGGALTDILADTEHEVRVYDALLYEDDYLKPVPFIRGDVRDRDLLARHLRWADAVVWLAALVGDGACALRPELTRELNLDSVKWLAENFNGRIVFLSTCSVYGASPEVCTEGMATNPLSLYAETKLAAELHLAARDAITFRLGTLYGLGDAYSRIRLDLVVNTMTMRAITERKLHVFGGQQHRPLLHVRDAAQAIVNGLGTRHAGIFNLHSENVRIFDIARRVRDLVPDAVVVTTDAMFEDLRSYRVTSDKAGRLLDFTPRLTVEDGIIELKSLIADRRIKNLEHPRYRNQEYLADHLTVSEAAGRR